jgi:gamma-glutamyltranspeptidase/glutathione hydrolase
MTLLEFNSRRSPVYSNRGLVGATQPLAVAAGLEVLRLGGNAADAAVATSAALGVTEPFSTGLGGDCFALFYEAKSGQISALNGSGRAPAALTIERLKVEGIVNEIPSRHPHAVTVPGCCAGWCDLVDRLGRLDLGKVLAPAIRLAEAGFPVAPLTSLFWSRAIDEQLEDTPDRSGITINGRAPKAGEIFRNAELANVLIKIAEQGKAVFYQGEIGERIVQSISQAGGCMDLEDLAGHQSTWEDPISTDYRGVRIWECPPNGQGLAALLALNILEGFDLPGLPALSSQRLHLGIESMRLAFADALWYVSDPAFSQIPLEALLSKEYAARRRSLIDMRKAKLDHEHDIFPASSDTVYLSVVDEEGNACSFISSNYHGFGTGIVPEGCGFSLQNRGSSFSLDATHPNALAPRKRPYHTIIPAMATIPGADREQFYACFGVMGDFMQPQGQIQVITAVIDDGLDPQSALDRPRFRLLDGSPAGPVALEEGIPINEMSALAEMGHSVVPVSGLKRAIFGRGQIILRDPNSGVLCGGSDPRMDGCVMSY